jgi:hypothetical protein
MPPKKKMTIVEHMIVGIPTSELQKRTTRGVRDIEKVINRLQKHPKLGHLLPGGPSPRGSSSRPRPPRGRSLGR